MLNQDRDNKQGRPEGAIFLTWTRQWCIRLLFIIFYISFRIIFILDLTSCLSVVGSEVPEKTNVGSINIFEAQTKYKWILTEILIIHSQWLTKNALSWGSSEATPLAGGVTAKSALKFGFKMASNLVLFVGIWFIYFDLAYTWTQLDKRWHCASFSEFLRILREFWTM